jgi:3alpha(or 20beta)-hydroxysteroid dehydrogenase
MGALEGKVAIITGAARGQGAAAARLFVAEGARVVVGDVLDDLGKELADSLGDAAIYRHLDVTSEDDWSSVVNECVQTWGGVDILVNNAGILRFIALPETSLEDYLRIVNVNQVGTFLGMRTVSKPMMAAGTGSIVNISSIEGLAGMPYLTAYTSTKFAIRGMTKVCAIELGPDRIRVNSVHPGAIDTQMVSSALGGLPVDMNFVGQRVALQRVGLASEVASLVTFLASDESAYCTGGEFVIDGGATATHSLFDPLHNGVGGRG